MRTMALIGILLLAGCVSPSTLVEAERDARIFEQRAFEAEDSANEARAALTAARVALDTVEEGIRSDADAVRLRLEERASRASVELAPDLINDSEEIPSAMNARADQVGEAKDGALAAGEIAVSGLEVISSDLSADARDERVDAAVGMLENIGGIVAKIPGGWGSAIGGGLLIVAMLLNAAGRKKRKRKE